MTEMKVNRNLTGIKSVSLSTVKPVVNWQGHHSVLERTDLVREIERRNSFLPLQVLLHALLKVFGRLTVFSPYNYENQYMENIPIAFLLEYSSGFFLILKRTPIPYPPIVQSLISLILFTGCCREWGPDSDILHNHYPSVIERFAVMTNGFS